MKSVITPTLIDYVMDWTGIQLEAGSQPLLEHRLIRLLEVHDLKDGDELCQKLKIKSNLNIINDFLTAVTINETLWFRDSHPFMAMLDLIKEKIKEHGQVWIWSGACSYGQEPYSLAMHCHEQGLGQKVKFIASDLDEVAVKTAQNGVYDQFAMSRGMNQGFMNQYFKHKGDEAWEIVDDIKKMVQFKCINLNNIPPFPRPLDMILLRNVMIYFKRETKIKILENIVSQLKPGGILFVGGCESLIGLNDQLQMKSMDKSIYYIKK